MVKVFISYHHANDQWAKDEIQLWSKAYGIFEDVSVNTSEIEDGLATETIRCKIRDEYLRDSTVTLVLVGQQTRERKHVDWEIYSSMRDGPINKKSGILVVQLPSIQPQSWYAAHHWEKQELYPDCISWCSLEGRAEHEKRYPYLPDRIIDNLDNPDCKISVTNWDRIEGNMAAFKQMIEDAHEARTSNVYDFSRELRRRNS